MVSAGKTARIVLEAEVHASLAVAAVHMALDPA